MKKFLVIAVLLPSAALAHEWYDAFCCDKQHCRPVPCAEIQSDEKGYIFKGMRLDGKDVKTSKDENCHVCLGDFAVRPFIRCIYLPVPKISFLTPSRADF